MRLSTFRPRHRPRPRGARVITVLSVEPPAPPTAIKDPIQVFGVVPFQR